MKQLRHNIVISLITLSSLYLTSNSLFAQQSRAANVNVTTIKNTTLSPVAWVSGSVVSRNNSQIAAEISGRLINVIDLGTHVKKGDVIAQIDDQPLMIQLREEQANLDNNAAKLAFEKAEVERKKSLVARQLISEKELDETLANFSIAKANLDAAQARLDQIKQNLTYTKLKAPFDGIVTQRLSNQGEFVNNGNAIIRLVETANVESSLFAPLTAYKYLSQSKTLKVKSPLGEGYAAIKTIIPVAESRSHLMEVRLDMSEFDWPIGLNVKAAVATGEHKSVLAAPRDALVLRSNAISVFIIDDENNAKEVKVTVGISEDGLVELIGDVKAGDKVVIRGAERLQTGQAVNIKDNNNSLVSGNL